MANNGIDILTYAAAKAYTDKKVAGGGGSSINVVQGIGFSTEDVMSQAATTKMIYQGGTHPLAIRMGTEDESTYDDTISIGLMSKVTGQGGITIGSGASCTNSTTAPLAIGYGASASAGYTVVLGNNANASMDNGIAIGSFAKTTKYDAIAIGTRTVKANGGIAIGGSNHSDYGVASTAKGGVAIGFNSHATRQGEVNIGDIISAGYGFNNTAYRVIGGVHDGQELHDAATVAQGNTLATSAPTTSTAGVLGQLYTDTTAMHTYQCTAIDTTDPNNPSYTWTQRW